MNHYHFPVAEHFETPPGLRTTCLYFLPGYFVMLQHISCFIFHTPTSCYCNGYRGTGGTRQDTHWWLIASLGCCQVQCCACQTFFPCLRLWSACSVFSFYYHPLAFPGFGTGFSLCLRICLFVCAAIIFGWQQSTTSNGSGEKFTTINNNVRRSRPVSSLACTCRVVSRGCSGAKTTERRGASGQRPRRRPSTMFHRPSERMTHTKQREKTRCMTVQSWIPNQQVTDHCISWFGSRDAIETLPLHKGSA